jgi:hypothetical protein
MRRLGRASTRAALIYQHADRDSERAIAASLFDTITAALAGSNELERALLWPACVKPRYPPDTLAPVPGRQWCTG